MGDENGVAVGFRQAQGAGHLVGQNKLVNAGSRQRFDINRIRHISKVEEV
jgi:hypothetical protein